MNRFKAFCTDFPTLGGSAVIALFLLLLTGVNVNVLMARSKPFPEGYDGWFLLLGALATGTFAAMIGKRLSDFRWKAAGATTTTTTTDLPVPDAATTATTTTTTAPASAVPIAPTAAARDHAEGIEPTP
jgi:hypothetical protein